jgi:signal transduction histidine kinase
MTVRLRLTLWYTALLGATLIIFSVVVYSALIANLQSQVLEESTRQAQLVSRAIAAQIERNLALRDLTLPDLDYFTTSLGVQLVTRQGVVVRKSNNLANIAIPSYEQALPDVLNGKSHTYFTSIRNNPLLVYSEPLILNNVVEGMVQVIRPLTPLDNAVSQMGRYLIIGTGLSLIVAAVVGAFLARRELAPLAVITETARTITRAKDLDTRLGFATLDNEIGRLAATFNEMLDRIQQLFMGQERLVADVSHELRTPLTTIQGNMEILQRMATTTPERLSDQATFDLVQEIVDETANETDRMSRLIRDLLLLAQADSGVLRLQMELVELDTLLLDVFRQTQRMVEHMRGPNALDIRLGNEDQANVWGDRERLRQLLLNLADNAVKYTPNGGIVTFSLENSEGWIRVAVQDTGIGISPEQQQHIFERFFRTDKARSREMGGSGLGLSIVQWIAQAHQGHITVQSVPQQGSTFTLWLPEYTSPSSLPEGEAEMNGSQLIR